METKVLHIVDTLGLGGAQTLLQGIFQSQGKDFYLFALRKKEVEVEIKHENVIIASSSSKYSLKPLKELRTLIQDQEIGVLHCHLPRSLFLGWILKKFFFPNIKFIIHEHGNIFENNFFYNTFLKFAQKKVDLFLAVSKETKKQLIKNAKIKEEKIKVLYNFVDLEKFNKKNITWDIEKEKKKLGIKKNEFVIGFAGRLAKVKGCEYLIRSLPHLDFKYKCLIAGDGYLKKELEDLAKELKLEDKVIFLGYQENILKTYSLLDVLVIPSLSESFGLIAVEAQALGVPVVASNVPALNEIIVDRGNGLLFEGKNASDLAERMAKIHKNNKLRKMVIKSGLESVQKFSLSHYVEELNKINKSFGK